MTAVQLTAQRVAQDITAIRERGPLVHNITNYVVMNNTANALLSIGASPIMAHAMEELDDLLSFVNALVINIGTLSSPWVESMHKAGLKARERGIPVVLDPVGAGASVLRTQTACDIMDAVAPGIIRGNASEIMALATALNLSAEEVQTKGVDSLHGSERAIGAAQAISEKYACVVSVSGAVDVITDGQKTYFINNGDALMPRVTGMGCTATAITGAFAAVNDSALIAATHAMAAMGVAGEMAAAKSSGPGSFQMHFLDALYTIDEAELTARFSFADEN